MNTLPQDLAVLRAALVADEALLSHRIACAICSSQALCAQGKQLDEQAARLRGVALGRDTGLAELDTIMSTAESIVRDIVQVVRAGHLDHDAQTAFQCWISDALLQQPTTHQIDRLCRAAGFAGPVEADTMKQRVDELHATISGLRRELSECATQRLTLHNVGQILVERWAHSDAGTAPQDGCVRCQGLAQAIQTLATLLPPRPVVPDEVTAG
jgi:hypothetical protein